MQIPVCLVIVAGDQADIAGQGLAQEAFDRLHVGVSDHACDHVALALDGARDDRLTLAALVALAALADVAVLGLSADVGFVNLDNADQFLELFVHQASSHAMAHRPRGFVRAEAHDALDLESGDAFLAGHHHVDDAEPVPQRLVGVLEYSPGQVREPIGRLRRAGVALPIERARRQRRDFNRTAARTMNTIGPTVRHQIGDAGVFVGECRLKLRDRHLMDAGHFANSLAMKGICHG